MVHEEAHPDANIIWGTSFDETMNDEIRITIVATGFTNKNEILAAENSAKSETPTVATPVVTEDIFAATPAVEVKKEEVFAPAEVSYSAPKSATSYFDFTEAEAPKAEEVVSTPAVKEEAPKQQPDNTARASYQEYNNMFDFIRRIKK